jgi:hypothetical protein
LRWLGHPSVPAARFYNDCRLWFRVASDDGVEGVFSLALGDLDVVHYAFADEEIACDEGAVELELILLLNATLSREKYFE